MADAVRRTGGSPRYPTMLKELYTAFDYAGTATATQAPRLSLRYCDESSHRAAVADTTRFVYALRRRADLLGRMGRADLRAPTSIRRSLP